MKERISQLSRGFMLPISLLPIAGLFLGIGSAMVNIVASHFHGVDNLSEGWNSFITFANFVKGSGDVIFGNLPILFAVAIAITFTTDAGGAALTAVIAWLVFNAAQAAFISPNMDGNVVKSYNLFWKHNWTPAIFNNNDGMVSLQTSVFGGITVGAISALMYNKFYKIEFHPIVSFFSGIRFVPIITFLAIIPVALIFLFVWPYIGQGFAWFGNHSAKWPGGMDSFVFGYLEKALTPFGLHHAFYTPLWFSSAGGTFNSATTAIASGTLHIDGTTVAIHKGNTIAQDFALAHKVFTVKPSSGDINMWFAADNNSINFQDLKHLYGLNLGRFDQGQYTTMIFGLPAAAAAMIMSSKLEFRREATGIIGSAALTSMLTGITEPIEFTFLFLAPLLFWGFHALMAALSFMLLNLLGAHVGMTFSGGIIDWCIYGWLPFELGTKPYMIFVIGLPLIPIYYFVFYWAINKWDIKTPGRSDDGDSVRLMSKAEYKAQKSNGNSTTKEAARLLETKNFIKALGGVANLKIVNACATRLRLTLNNGSLINEGSLKKLGSFGIIGKGTNSIQVILGGKANVVKSRINDYINKSPKKIN